MQLLKKMIALEQEAKDFGFNWDNTNQIMSQIRSECDEIGDQLQNPMYDPDKIKLQEEIGDLLHAVFSLCIFCELSPETTLEKSLIKFERRLNAVKQIANSNGLTTLKNLSFDELMEYWKKAKKLVDDALPL